MSALSKIWDIVSLIKNSEVVGSITDTGKGKKRDTRVYNCVSAFDIEVSKIPTGEKLGTGEAEYRSVMYIWQFSVEGEITVYGRTWAEFLEFFETLDSLIDYKFVVYVHNLSYEFSFIHGIYPFKNDDIFFMNVRKPLYFKMFNHLEFRCSYRLFNMNLQKVMEVEEVPEQYQKTELDYSIVRYPWTDLTDEELIYCRNDVLGLCLAIKNRLTKTGDTMETIPLTSTGYIRRLMKEATQAFREQFKYAAPDTFIYKMLRSAFRGGNTHANRQYSGVMCYNVKSIDVTSSYPYCLLCRDYPLTAFRFVKYTREQIESIIRQHRKALLIHCKMYNIKTEHPIPYISFSKCINTEPKHTELKKDNGRILEAEMVEVSITDIDYKIIVDQYQIESIEFLHVFESDYLPLPRPAKQLIQKLYYDKCTLKKKDAYLYARSKELLNACYGMAAQDILNFIITFNAGNYKINKEPASTYLLIRNTTRNALPYAVGVWCTAYAREHLEAGFSEVMRQGGKIVYCDTDSIKYTGEVDLTEMNKAIAKKSYTVQYEGTDYILGTFASEATADLFKTLGAKKYVCQYGDKLKITIAGVPKEAGARELEEAGGIHAFQKGFVFRAGKLMSVYNDEPFACEIDGHRIESRSDVTLYETEYTVGLSSDYEELISDNLQFEKVVDIMKINKYLREEVTYR